MTAKLNPAATRAGFIARLFDYSAEVTTPDRTSLDAAARQMPADARVYVAALPKDTPARQLAVCREVRALGLIPVPHIVARSIPDRAALDDMLGRLAREAGVDRALILGGDRERPAGEYDSSLQLIESGLLQQSLAKNLRAHESPRQVIIDLEAAVLEEPSLNVWGIHFFTFASLRNTIEWVKDFTNE